MTRGAHKLDKMVAPEVFTWADMFYSVLLAPGI